MVAYGSGLVTGGTGAKSSSTNLSPIPAKNFPILGSTQSTSGGILGQAASGTTVTGAPAASSSPFGLTTGWYVFFGVGAGVLLSGTQIAPIILGVLSSALLYQISQLIEGK